MKSKLSSPMKSQLSSQMKSQFSQHLPINPGLYHGFTLKSPGGSPHPQPPGIPSRLALLLQRQLRRQRRGLRLLSVEAAAAQEVFELGQQRHGAPSMALREDPPEKVGVWCVWLVFWAWNGIYGMNLKI